MKPTSIDAQCLTAGIRDAWSALGLDATDPSAAFHAGAI